jgi:DNA-binding MarR family transcriptional regulator
LSRRLRPTAAGAAAGLTPTRISVLFTIARRGPIRLSELAQAEGLNPTMLSRVIADFADS